MRDLIGDVPMGRDPVDAARAGQRPPLPKRFYSAVTVDRDAGGAYRILLDGRPVRTPARAVLAVPDLRLAEALAAEWAAQDTEIDPFRMPLTRLVNVALDGVARDPEAAIAEILQYAGTDLLCYRAEAPEALVARQGALWDPVLDWYAAAHGARFMLSAGIRHVAQPPRALERVAALIPREALRLTAVLSLTGLMGSALLALALAQGRLGAAEAWAAAHVDEDWNRAQWGEDDLASQRRAAREVEMQAAATLLRLLD
ncbi:ATP12 family chaperone protein [Aquabacter spiritensis]|uniref:Chaperone required for assembly of F1-ATPase n=1 Tax=Aquabacter spiritensis TaxID=933073 RepID=A0A4V2UWU0_9HYPH|nr:ATP12 family protein [Aquabacter spiritensis]TCT00948.1 chaperone required for assembly of F1-ATPase [Aquabacter spiritensis]